MQSTLSIADLTMLIKVVLSSQSDNNNIPAMSGSDVCFVSSNFGFLPFGMSYNFFLIDGHDVPGKRNYCKQFLSNVVVKRK